MRHLLPQQIWALLHPALDPAPHSPTNPNADAGSPLLIDVRMEIEMLYVGRPPHSEHVSWYEYPDFIPDPAHFCARVEHLAGSKSRTVILLCRSGHRSVPAGDALEAQGFTDVVNVLHGFEGDLDVHFHRSTVNGWRFDGLPWEQM